MTEYEELLSDGAHEFTREALRILRRDRFGYILREDPASFWTLAVPDGRRLATHGWKLHVSATERDAIPTLQKCLPGLFSEGAHFKFAASSASLRQLNSGEAGPTQVGKFLTVYPRTDEAALTLAAMLDRTTLGLLVRRLFLSLEERCAGAIIHSIIHYIYVLTNQRQPSFPRPRALWAALSNAGRNDCPPPRSQRQADSEMAPQGIDIAQSGLGNGARPGGIRVRCPRG
jgi:hypothetical protein